MKTYIHFLLDRSGSMWECLNETISEFNTFINSQKNNGECYFSLYQFDNEYDIIYKDIHIDNIPCLNIEQYIPRGNTALLDAIGLTIDNINNKIENTIIVILTDGYENCSKLFTKDEVFNKITKKQEDGYKFIFLAANQDAIQSACDLGINKDSALTYSQKPNNIKECFRALSNQISKVRHDNDGHIIFSKEERINSLG